MLTILNLHCSNTNCQIIEASFSELIFKNTWLAWHESSIKWKKKTKSLLMYSEKALIAKMTAFRLTCLKIKVTMLKYWFGIIMFLGYKNLTWWMFLHHLRQLLGLLVITNSETFVKTVENSAKVRSYFYFTNQAISTSNLWRTDTVFCAEYFALMVFLNIFLKSTGKFSTKRTVSLLNLK